MIEVVHRLRFEIPLGFGGFFGIELDLELVFGVVLGCSTEEGDAVIARKGADVATNEPNVSRESTDQEDGSILEIIIEKLVGSHTKYDGRLLWVGGNLASQSANRFGWRPRQLLDLFWGIRIIEHLSSDIEHGAALDLLAVGQSDFMCAAESGS